MLKESTLSSDKKSVSAIGNDDLLAAFSTLKAMQPRWSVEVGQPVSQGWLSGVNLQDATTGKFNQLLNNIGTRMGTDKRKVVAASFALRFGWSSGIVFGPFLINSTVADVQLSNLSMKFNDNTLFEQAALHKMRVFDYNDQDEDDLIPLSPIQRLQTVLVAQAEPVVEALHHWSRFSRRAIWGQITSSWGAQCAQLLQMLDRTEETSLILDQFFATLPVPPKTSPRFYSVASQGHCRYYHKRASCCLYYKISPARFCTSCPLIDETERLKRNQEWLEKTILSMEY